MKDSINIVEYNSNWTELAKLEINVLKKLLSDRKWFVDIEHIGSTAVPGLAAKPIIDIYIGAHPVKDAYNAVELLEGLGYQFWRDNPNREKLFFVKGMPPLGKGRTHHIHIVESGSDYWNARILFRDYLRAHTHLVKEYAELKYKLAQIHTEDREAYTDAKHSFIKKILKKAGFKGEVNR